MPWRASGRMVFAMSNSKAATVITYSIDPANADKLCDGIREHLVPAARKNDGYRGFLVIDAGSGKRVACVVFDSAEQGRAAQTAIGAAARDSGIYGMMAEPQQASFGVAIVADGIFAG
jgi:hypothetical protein